MENNKVIDILKITITSKSVDDDLLFGYKDELVVTPNSVSYDFIPNKETKINPKKSFHFETNDVLFNANAHVFGFIIAGELDEIDDLYVEGEGMTTFDIDFVDNSRFYKEIHASIQNFPLIMNQLKHFADPSQYMVTGLFAFPQDEEPEQGDNNPDKFWRVVDYIPKIEEGNFAQIIIEDGNKGEEFKDIKMQSIQYENFVLKFMDDVNSYIELPEFKEVLRKYLLIYHDVIEKLGVNKPGKYLIDGDFSKLNATEVFVLLYAIVKQEQYYEGILLSALESGLVLKLLERLKLSDDESQKVYYGHTFDESFRN